MNMLKPQYPCNLKLCLVIFLPLSFKLLYSNRYKRLMQYDSSDLKM